MKKIMFNDTYLLTQAVLEGRKTMTRRIIDKKKNEYFLNLLSDKGYMKNTGTLSYDDEFGEFRIDDVYECTTCRPMYKIGEVVAVAQSMCDVYAEFDMKYLGKDTKELMKKFGGSACFGNKMFVKASDMPHQIRITDIKIEKLQDISDEDCLAEGVELNTRQYQCDKTRYYCVRGLGHWRSFGCYNYNSPREAYAVLIDKVSGKGTWESNPYVFAYEFQMIK